MVKPVRLPTAGQHSIEREAIAPSGALACVRSAYVRLRAQAGESSKRRIICERSSMSRAAMVKSSACPRESLFLPRTSRVCVLPRSMNHLRNCPAVWPVTGERACERVRSLL